MKKSWEHSVVVAASPEHVFALVADFTKHAEWDRFTKKAEITKPGGADGVGAEWKVYEQMGIFSLGERTVDSKHLTGLAKRTVTEMVSDRRVSWRTHALPNVGVSADLSYEFSPEGDGTRVAFRSEVNVPGVVEKVGRVILRSLDKDQQKQWQASLEQLKSVAEESYARSLLAV